MRQEVRLLALLVLIGVSVVPAQAAVITVADGEVAVNPGNGKCSLIEAINNSESDSDTSGGDCVAGSGADTIDLAPNSTYSLTAPYTQVELGTNDTYTGLPGIRHSLTIDGQGSTIQRDPSLWSGTACGGSGAKFRILYIPTEGVLTVNNLTIMYGCAASGGGGGAVFNNGTLTLDTVTVKANGSPSNGAGGIHNNGTLTLLDSTVADNQATNAAGGGIVNRGVLNVTRSTISGNGAIGAGGGVDVSWTAAVAIKNSTLSGNSSNGLGGGMWNEGNASTMTNVTVANNAGAALAAAPTPGSGIATSGGSVTMKNVLLANQVNGSNCSGSFSGNNNLSDDATCPATQNVNPQLGALASNGGTTQTHALPLGSPAIDAGDDTAASGLTTDQRGTGFARLYGLHVDIGAYEYGSDSDPIPPSVEDAVPNLSGSGTGDGNGDGIADSQQASVASLNAAAGGVMATIATGASTITLTSVQALAPTADAPPGVTFPYGLFGFTLSNVTPGATVNVTLYVPYNAAINGYWKKNKSGQWVNVATSITQDGNKTKIVFPLTEGGAFDFDSNTTTITDPGGPGIGSAGIHSIPSLSEWGMILLSCLLGLGTIFTLRRKRM